MKDTMTSNSSKKTSTSSSSSSSSGGVGGGIERDRDLMYYFELGLPMSVFQHFCEETSYEESGSSPPPEEEEITVSKLYRWFGLTVFFMAVSGRDDTLAYGKPTGYGVNFPGKERILNQSLHEWIKSHLQFDKKVVTGLLEKAWERVVVQGGVAVDSEEGQEMASKYHYDRFDFIPYRDYDYSSRKEGESFGGRRHKEMNWLIHWLEWGLLVAYLCYRTYVSKPMKHGKFLRELYQELLLRTPPRV